MGNIVAEMRNMCWNTCLPEFGYSICKIILVVIQEVVAFPKCRKKPIDTNWLWKELKTEVFLVVYRFLTKFSDNESAFVLFVLCEPHTCTCGARLATDGSHGLSSILGPSRTARHGILNNLICRWLTRAGFPAIKKSRLHNGSENIIT